MYAQIKEDASLLYELAAIHTELVFKLLRNSILP